MAYPASIVKLSSGYSNIIRHNPSHTDEIRTLRSVFLPFMKRLPRAQEGIQAGRGVTSICSHVRIWGKPPTANLIAPNLVRCEFIPQPPNVLLEPRLFAV